MRKRVRVRPCNIPVIAFGENGLPVHLDNDLKTYGVIVSGYQIVDWDFEQKTLDQIAAKRQATMAIITAKANADRAKQDSITAEEEGKKDVTVARYTEEVEKIKAVVKAERSKEVAIITAQQNVEVAEKGKLEAEQKKFAAGEYKQEQTLRGEGDAAYKQKVMEADGALEQKLRAFVEVNREYAKAISKYKGNWVPSVVMSGQNASSSGSGAQTLIDMLTAKAAKDLSLDLSVPPGANMKSATEQK